MILTGRTLLVMAHPDDETVGFSAHLPRLGADLTLVHATDGAPRQLFASTGDPEAWRALFAQGRRGEMLSAVALAGLREAQCISLGLADQEAALSLAALTQRVHDGMRDLRPALVVTHPYEGGHPDHDACAFAVSAAARMLLRASIPPPLLVECASYHRRDGRLCAFEFLPSPDAAPAQTIELSPAERDLKQRMYACYASQSGSLAELPISIERHRPAPSYDFTRPPHEGQLHYETFASGMTGPQWIELARAALLELGL